MVARRYSLEHSRTRGSCNSHLPPIAPAQADKVGVKTVNSACTNHVGGGGRVTDYTTSVLIPSFRRPAALKNCLLSLAAQTRRPGEVIVVWQADDTPTRDTAEQIRQALPYELRLIHHLTTGIVPAENEGLTVATGQIILLIDDDALAPPDWIARHLACYSDRGVGAVGGPAVNFYPDGTPFPKRAAEPVGKLTWYGRAYGNLYDHVEHWASRSSQEADGLVGYNMSLRREAFDRFEERLQPYWQLFELDACLQVKGRGYRVIVDFVNAVQHYPTNTAYVAGRHGDLAVKVYNAAYNYSFILAKHSPWYLRAPRLQYLLAVGSVNSPGLASFFVAVRRYGSPLREAKILLGTWQHLLAGWQAGRRAARSGAR